MPFNLFPILWRLLLLKINELLNFHYFFRNFTCNSPNFTTISFGISLENRIFKSCYIFVS